MTALIDWFNSRATAGMSYCFWLSLATLIFTFNLEKRSHGFLRAVISIASFMLVCLAIPPLTHVDQAIFSMAWFLAAYLINVLVIFSYCKVSIWEAMYCAMFSALTEHLSSSAYILLFVTTSNWDITYSLISLVVYAAVWFLAGRKMAHNGHYHVHPGQVILTSVVAMLVLVVLSYLCKHTADPYSKLAFESNTVRSMLQLSQWYAIAFCAVMMAVELGQQQQLQSQLDLAASHELLRVHEQQYRLTRENIDMINRKCHDMKHQIALLMETPGGDAALRERYGNEIIKMIEVYDTNIDTGNEVLNTVLRDKSLFCSMNGITWTCAAHGEALDFMDPMDLVAMMGNALDNALEAVARIADRKQQIISVQIAPKHNMMQILIENTFDGTLNRVGKQLLTRKEDRDYHGIGVKSIIAIAEKYGGYALADAQGNTFILNILIPIPEKS